MFCKHELTAIAHYIYGKVTDERYQCIKCQEFFDAKGESMQTKIDLK